MQRKLTFDRISASAAALLLVAALTTCGLAAGTAAAAGAGVASGASHSSSRVVAVAKKLVAQYENPPAVWTGPKSSPPLAKNKTIVVVDINSATQGSQRATAGLEAAAKVAGWRIQVIDTVGDPTKMNDAIHTAIDEHADGIAMWAIPIQAVQASLEAAKAAHIPVISAFDGERPGNPLITHVMDFNAFAQGKAIGAAIIANLGTNARVLLMNWPDNLLTTQRTEGAVAYIKHAGGHVLSSQTFQMTDLGTPTLTQKAVALAQANPTANAMFVGFDAAAGFIVPAIREAGLARKTPVYSFDGNSPDVQDVVDAAGQVADVGVPLEWMGWAVLDDFNRIFHGERLPVSDGLPFKLLEKNNTTSGAAWQGNYDYQAKYKQLWGLK